MGNRHTKELKLNGIVVGEYLGSDDTDEDIEAARWSLRDKGLYKPPTLVQAMRGQAEGFTATAHLAYERMRLRGTGDPPTTMVPFIVNAAFAVELYLKTLLRSAGVVPPRQEHELVKLHAQLPSNEQARIEELCVHQTQDFDPGTSDTFSARLVPLNNAFVRWRYAYEYDRAGPVRPRSLILVLAACHEACRDAS